MKKTIPTAITACILAIGSSTHAQEARPCVLGQESTDMQDRAVIVADNIHTGDLDAEDFSFFAGDVLANTASFGPEVIISGDLTVGTIEMGVPLVAGTLTTGVTTEFPLPTAGMPSSAIPEVETEPDETITVPPGEYSLWRIAERSTVNLSAGEYDFITLQAEEDVVFNLDLSDGPIRIDSQDDIGLGYRTEVRVLNGHPNDVSIFTTNLLNLRDDGLIQGTVFSKNIVRLGNRAEINGCVEGENLELGYDARIIQPS